MQVRNRITGKTFEAPPRYWVQSRKGETFEVRGKFANSGDAKQSAARIFRDGGYVEVIVQNIDSGRRVAAFPS